MGFHPSNANESCDEEKRRFDQPIWQISVSIIQMKVRNPPCFFFIFYNLCSSSSSHRFPFSSRRWYFLPALPAGLSSTVINGSGPWTRYKMRDFSGVRKKCARGSQTERESGAGGGGKHRAPCLRPTRRPPIASAPCLKSLPWCHLPSCSQPGLNSGL